MKLSWLRAPLARAAPRPQPSAKRLSGGPRFGAAVRPVPVTSLRLVEMCSSCGKRLLGKGATTFACPSCGSGKLGRCAQCRDQSVLYTCPDCGFQGP